ncbi:biopolymer transporter ExbD [Leisingera sp. NJS201]|uniref:biopolymer transporter ExbD n=1 Tax=Leisingera sp. NJS201 TaxID=2508306 RepID=UPI0020C74BD7|nr:biopolymer transporter ExbD [Leisingera sp. NJS201]
MRGTRRLATAGRTPLDRVTLSAMRAALKPEFTAETAEKETTRTAKAELAARHCGTLQNEAGLWTTALKKKRLSFTPMIDVVFLLLIFFLLTSQIAPRAPTPFAPPRLENGDSATPGILHVKTG